MALLLDLYMRKRKGGSCFVMLVGLVNKFGHKSVKITVLPLV